MAAGDPVNSAFESNPTDPDLAGRADNELRETRQRLRYRLQRTMDYGDGSTNANYEDTGRPVPGSARAFFVDGTNITGEPSTWLKSNQVPPYAAQTLAIPSAGASPQNLPALGTHDDGVMMWVKGSAFPWDGTGWSGVDATASTGHFAEESTVTGAAGATAITATTQGTAQVMVQDSGAGTPELNLDVTPGLAGVGFWRVEVKGWIPVLGGGAGQVVFGLRKIVDPAGAGPGPITTDYWDAGGGDRGSTAVGSIEHFWKEVPVLAADRGELHRFQAIAYRVTNNFTIGRTSATVIATLQAKVIPHG